MGWTSYHANYYKKGRVDRKAECDAYFMEDLNAGHFKIIKSALVESVYYAAVETLKRYVGEQPDGTSIYEDIPEAERRVWGAVFLTSVNSKDYYNFSYKEMSEDVGPSESNCPVSILKLLSPTDSQQANEWRKRCMENAEKKRSPGALANLPIGAVIWYVLNDGTAVELIKHQPAYQFKRPFWYYEKEGTYVPAMRIPKDYKVVSK